MSLEKRPVSLIYGGVTVYPLFESTRADENSVEVECAKCMFVPAGKTACRRFQDSLTGTSSCATHDILFYWAEGPEAQAQYILERLTS